LAGLRIVRISQDAEFVSFVSRPARTAQRRSDTDDTKKALARNRGETGRNYGAPSQNDTRSVVPDQVMGDLP